MDRNDIPVNDRIQDLFLDQMASGGDVPQYETAFALMEEQGKLLAQYNKARKTQSNPGVGIPVDLSNLPWDAKEEDIRQFLLGVELQRVLIVLDNRRRASGQARVWVSGEEDLRRALGKDSSSLGSRKVTVKTGLTDQSKEAAGEGYYVKLARLPWTVTANDIIAFLYGSEVLWVRLEQDGDRARGDALVGLKSLADVENAVKFHKQEIGGRSIDIYQCESLFPEENPQCAISSPGQILPPHQQPDQRSRIQVPPSLAPPHLPVLSLPGPSYPQLTNQSNDTLPIPVDLLSLPWSATEEQIRRFVGSEVAVLKVLIVLNEYRKPSGRARVWLQTEDDVCRVLERSNQYLDTRRVEVRRGVPDLGRDMPGDHYIRLDRLPWEVTESQIRDFLFGCQIEKVDIERDERGRVRGDALVKVATLLDVENALLYHKQLMGRRNIDVSGSSSVQPVIQ